MAELLSVFVGAILVDLNIGEQRRVGFLHVGEMRVVTDCVERKRVPEIVPLFAANDDSALRMKLTLAKRVVHGYIEDVACAVVRDLELAGCLDAFVFFGVDVGE